MAGNIYGHPALLGLVGSRVKLEKRNNEYWGLCPFHPDKNPSFSISLKNGEYLCYCFGCGYGSNILGFLQKFDNIKSSEAKRIIEEAAKDSGWEEAKAKADEVFQKLETVQEEIDASKYVKFEISLYESKEAQEWLFRERGITYDAARKCRFGYAKTLDQVTKKYDREELKDCWDKGWITFASIEGDKVLCIEARSMVRKVTRIRTGMTNKVLFGVDNLTIDSPVFVTEGKFDQAVLLQAGYNAVSLPNASASLTPEMRDKLMLAPVRFLAGDNDGGAGSTKMLKMWNDFQEATYLIVWPQGCKDANDVFLKVANRDVNVFKTIVDKLVMDAYANPMVGVKSLEDVLRNSDSGKAEDNPDRFRFGLSGVDRMANILPGSVVYLSATQTGTGKTQLTIQESLNASRKFDEVVLNYQAELTEEEVGEIVTANLLAKDRNELDKEDRLKAAKLLKGCLYYIGNNPNLTTADEVLDLIEAGVRRVGATTVILDHIHFITQNEKDEYRAQAKAMNRIKRIAQKYKLKFFVVGQPRKPGKKEAGKPIDIYDAKGSEAILSNSDVILLMHREPVKNMTEETADPLSPEVQIRCMKGRSKGRGSAFKRLYFLGRIAQFREIEPAEEPMKTEFDF